MDNPCVNLRVLCLIFCYKQVQLDWVTSHKVGEVTKKLGFSLCAAPLEIIQGASYFGTGCARARYTLATDR